MPRFVLSVEDFVGAFADGAFFADDFFAADLFRCAVVGKPPTTSEAAGADSPEAPPASDSDAVSSTTTRKSRATGVDVCPVRFASRPSPNVDP